jgi:hypothetical protein
MFVISESTVFLSIAGVRSELGICRGVQIDWQVAVEKEKP